MHATADKAEIDGLRTADAAAAGRTRFPRNLAVLEARVQAQKERPVDCAEAARVMNAIRYNPHRAANTGRVPTHAQLAAGITAQHLADWNKALGLQAEEVTAMRNMAFAGGLFIPSSNTVMNLMTYLVIPFATQKVSNPWVQAGVSLAMVTAQPFITAPLQTLAVSAIDVFRQKNAPSVQLDKASINAKLTQHAIAEDLAATAGEMEEGVRQMEAMLARFAAAHPVQADAGQDPMVAALGQLTEAEQAEFRAACDAQASRFLKLGALTTDLQKIDGVHARQWWSTVAQIAPRAARAGSGMPVPFVKQPGQEQPGSWTADVEGRKMSPGQATGLAVGVAMGAQLMQHLMAGVDEITAQSDEHKLNMLHADVLTDSGRAKWEAGEALGAEDVSESKLRGLVAQPETAMVNRVAGILKKRVAALEDEMNQQGVPIGDLESGAGPAGGEAAQRLRDRHAEYQADQALLASGDVTQLSATGEARQLLANAMQGTAVSYAWTEGVTKLLSPLEFSAQLGQRIAQSFTLGVLGSAGAVVGGRVVNAVLGGSEHTPMSTQFYLSVASTVVGAFAAASQYMVVNVKNERRDGGEMGLANQVWRGVISPLLEASGAWASAGGMATATAAITAHQANGAAAISALAQMDAMPGSWPLDP